MAGAVSYTAVKMCTVLCSGEYRITPQWKLELVDMRSFFKEVTLMGEILLNINGLVVSKIVHWGSGVVDFSSVTNIFQGLDGKHSTLYAINSKQFVDNHTIYLYINKYSRL